MMNRRDFSIVSSLLGLGLLPLAGSARAQTPAFQADTDYQPLPRQVPVDAPAGKVEVIEFFSYNCPHCFVFEPVLENWLKTLPSYAVFRRVPVPFVGNDRNDLNAKQRLYYTLEIMGKANEFQYKFFQAVQPPGSRYLSIVGEKAIIDWVKRQPGLDSKKFLEIFHSFTVTSKASRATQLTNGYQVQAVPSLGVAGRWYIDVERARTEARMLQIVESLIAQAHRGA